MEAQLIQIKKKPFIDANKEIATRLLESLGINIPASVLDKGLLAELPCRLEIVPE